MATRILRLYPFRFRDPLSGKWPRARHVLDYPTLMRRYEQFEVSGPAEVREVQENWQALTAGRIAQGQR